MGVIHKLKKEVLDFIIAYKMKEPDISCRKLVEIVQKKFDIKVSKSSINAIFKSASLSNPVGRRTSSKNAKKFQIPGEKIQELFPQEKKVVFIEKRLDDDVSLMSRKEERKAICKEKIVENEKLTMSIQQVKEEDVYLEHLGSVFLKAAINELTEGSILNKMLPMCCDSSVLMELKNADILLFLELFGLKDVAAIEQSAFSSIWKLNNVQYSKATLSAISSVKSQCNCKKLKLTAAIELAQMYKEISRVSIHFSDGFKINLDGSFSSMWQGMPPVGLSGPFYSVVSRLNSEIIENVQEWNINSMNDSNIELFGHLVQALEKEPKIRLDKIAIFDSKNEEMADFPYIPSKKRTIFCGLLPSQVAFKTILKASKLSQKFTGIEGERIYYYRESEISLNAFVFIESSIRLKVYFVSNKIGEDPFIAIITNNLDAVSSREQLINFLIHGAGAAGVFKEYLHKKESFGDMRKAFEEKDAFNEQQAMFTNEVNHSITKAYDFSEILQLILNQLNKFCQYRYFPSSCRLLTGVEMLNEFYSLPGFIKETEKYIIISFKKDDFHKEKEQDLIFSVRRVNEEKIWAGEKRLMLRLL